MNTTHYFSNCQTVAEIKSEYRRLALLHHPDRGGDTETMKQINRQYKVALEQSHGETSTGSDGEQHTYYYNEYVEQAIVDKVAEFFALQLPDSVEIALIGTWLWVTGDTKPHKDAIKSIKMRWHSKRVAWYFKTGKQRSTYNANASLGDLAAQYGYKKFQDDDKPGQAKAPALS
jgi:hypothetical protein